MSAREQAPTFTAAARETLGGPTWLRGRRAAAHELLAHTPLPHPNDEDWRYGRLGELDLTQVSPLGTAVAPAGASALERLERSVPELAAAAQRFVEHLGELGALAVALDGAVLGLERGPAAEKAGVRLTSLATCDEAPAGLGARLSGAVDAFGRLAEAFLADGLVVQVPAGAQLEEPIVLIHVAGPASRGHAVFPRTLVEVGEGAAATVIELQLSSDGMVLLVPVSEISVGPGAHATYCSSQELGAGAWQLGYQASEIERGGVLRSFAAALGGAYARHWSRTVLAGEGGESELLAVYLGHGDQVQEFRTFQEHLAARTRSELVFKGAVGDNARSVYTGLVRMHHGARRADAAQTNRNLVLSGSAEAYSVPNLDIQENDVRCSHASAVGPIDREQLFYLESRGVPTAVAERLILLGFFEDLLARAPDAGFGAHLRAIVAERLAPGSDEAALLAAVRGAQ